MSNVQGPMSTTEGARESEQVIAGTAGALARKRAEGAQSFRRDHDPFSRFALIAGGGARGPSKSLELWAYSSGDSTTICTPRVEGKQLIICARSILVRSVPAACQSFTQKVRVSP